MRMLKRLENFAQLITGNHPIRLNGRQAVRVIDEDTQQVKDIKYQLWGIDLLLRRQVVLQVSKETYDNIYQHDKIIDLETLPQLS